MGKSKIHKNNLIPISKDVILDTTLSVPARGLYAIMLAMANENDKVDLNDLTYTFEMNMGTNFCLQELLEHNLITKTEIDNCVIYDVRGY